MYQRMYTLFLLFACLFGGLSAAEPHYKPICTVLNPCKNYSLINSVDFHPKEHLLAVTYTFGNRVVLYKHAKVGNLQISQTLDIPHGAPQHAVFTPDGETLVVANWLSQEFTIYRRENGQFNSVPDATISKTKELAAFRFHGIAFSPCGRYLAVAYGATSEYDRALAIFHFDPKKLTLKLTCAYRGEEEVSGVPKGITFSPDGNAILVTFSDKNSLEVFNFSKISGKMAPHPRQIVQGNRTGIFRPEDVKISPDGTLCAISNSEVHTVSFFPFNARTNTITRQHPLYTLSDLTFPHGLAFSADQKYFCVTQFGPIKTDEKGNIYWNGLEAHESKVTLYKSIKN